MHLATSALTFLEFAGIVFALPHSADREAPAKGRFRGTINTPKQTRGTGTALLNLAYTFMTVTIDAGTPPQAQTLTFDTGSPFLWIFTGNTNGLYDISQSSTFQNQSVPFNSGLGPTGYWACETVNMGGLNIAGAVLGIVDGAGHGKGGAMGFSPPSATNPAQGTWTSEMAAVLESPVAGLNIYEESNGPISFGYLDSTQYSGDLTWVPVNTTKGSSWTVDTVYYSINGHPTSSSAGLPALMDTGGTTFLSLDQVIVREYHSNVPSAKDISAKGDASSWTVDCKAVMPDLELAFGSNKNGVDDPAGEILFNRLINYSSNTNGTCQAYLHVGGAQVLSRAFFTSNYVAFDFTQGASKVGIAPKKVYEVIPTS